MGAFKVIRIGMNLLLMIAMISCVDEYWPNLLPKYENLLVEMNGGTPSAGFKV